MKVLYITDVSSLPIKTSQGYFGGRAVAGGQVFSVDAASLLETHSIPYEEIDDSEVEAISVSPLCVRCGRESETSTCAPCEISENKDKGKIKRQATIDYLIELSEGTNIEPHVNQLLARYSEEVLSFEQTGDDALKDRIEAEDELPYTTYLDYVLAPNFTVKQSILLRLSQAQ